MSSLEGAGAEAPLSDTVFLDTHNIGPGFDSQGCVTFLSQILLSQLVLNPLGHFPGWSDSAIHFKNQVHVFDLFHCSTLASLGLKPSNDLPERMLSHTDCICLCEKFLWIVTGIPFGQKGRAPCLAPFELPQSFLQWPNSHCCQPSALEQPIGWSWLKLKRVRRMKLRPC